jgi:hypothetical protein
MDRIQIALIVLMLGVVLVISFTEKKMLVVPVSSSQHVIKEDPLYIRLYDAYVEQMNKIRDYLFGSIVRKDYDGGPTAGIAKRKIEKLNAEDIKMMRSKAAMTMMMKIVGVIFVTVLIYALLEMRKLGK